MYEIKQALRKWDFRRDDSNEILLNVNCSLCGADEEQIEEDDVASFVKRHRCSSCDGRIFEMYRPDQPDCKYCPLCEEFFDRWGHSHFEQDRADLQAWLSSGRSIEDWIPLIWIRFWEQEEEANHA